MNSGSMLSPPETPRTQSLFEVRRSRLARGVIGLSRALLACLFALALAVPLSAQLRKPAVPLDPISAILDAFRTHQVVALGEGNHGNEQGHAFRLSLIRDPRFTAVVRDIVVEFGNSKYQDVMDRFVRGEEVPEETIRRVSQDTTQPLSTFDVPIYEEFFRAVRQVNQSLPAERRLRVLLGEPPIDWESVRSRDDASRWAAERDTFAVDVIGREVLAKDRRVLVLAGDMRFQRRDIAYNYAEDQPQSQGIVRLLAPSAGVFNIWSNTAADLRTFQFDVASWPNPSLIVLRGTPFGAADFRDFYPFEVPRMTVRNGALVPVPAQQWRSLRMEEQFDALLYLGPPSEITYAQLSPALCADPAYLAMRRSRLIAAGFRALGLTQACASITQK
jgi:hypothetical protein